MGPFVQNPVGESFYLVGYDVLSRSFLRGGGYSYAFWVEIMRGWAGLYPGEHLRTYKQNGTYKQEAEHRPEEAMKGTTAAVRGGATFTDGGGGLLSTELCRTVPPLVSSPGTAPYPSASPGFPASLDLGSVQRTTTLGTSSSSFDNAHSGVCDAYVCVCAQPFFLSFSLCAAL